MKQWNVAVVLFIYLTLFSKILCAEMKTNPDSFWQILKKRVSIREFSSKALSKEDLKKICWAAYGQNADATTGATTRTVPSAGATYPLEIYVAVGAKSVSDIEEGLYHYEIEKDSLKKLSDKDLRTQLAKACLNQNFIAQAPVSLIIAFVSYRTINRYGQRGLLYVYMEAGHTCQNIYLAATCLGLATVEIGAFYNDELRRILELPPEFEVISVMPIGYKR